MKLYKYFSYLVLALAVMALPAHAALTGNSTTSANVGNIIAITVAEVAKPLGDVRTTTATNKNIMDVTISKNDDDGYTVLFQSGNASFPTAKGYLVHESTTASTTPNAGQMPSALYTLDFNYDSTQTTAETNGQAGTQTTPTAAGDQTNFTLDSDVTLHYDTAVTKSTILTHFDVDLDQTSDVDLFHGILSETITLTIADK